MSRLNHGEAERVVRRLKMHALPIRIPFVTPVLSAMLGAMTIHDRQISRVNFLFDSDAENYAGTNGLLGIIDHNRTASVRGGRQGKTYTKLTQLATHDEVDGCNAIVSELIWQQLDGYSRSIVSRLCRVIGELHDNVASHAGGAGFSCAQVYKSQNGAEVQFAIADAGCGMPYNVNRAVGSGRSDEEAICWCLKDGNTTSPPCDDWLQRGSPFAEPFTAQLDDHHLGLGLGQLVNLVKATGGELWILSGRGEYLLEPNGEHSQAAFADWQGVAIEMSIPVPRTSETESTDSQTLNDLGRRLGL